MTANKLSIGVIGCGHWGPNHVRVFSELERSEVRACADSRPERLDRIQRRFPAVRTTIDPYALISDRSIEAVVIATPTRTHAQITREALSAGKHVLVEKPLCTESAEAIELGELARQRGLVLMVGHVFLYNNGIIRLRELLRTGELGKVQYLDAVRTNLGPIRGDVNSLYDLGTHDISVFNYLIGAPPVEVSAVGRCICQPSVEDVCFASLRYSDGVLGHIHVSWLNPHKTRTLTVVGDRKMAHWDDISPFESLHVYDKGVAEEPHYNSFGEFQYLLRDNDVYLPRVAPAEPLVNQANAFLDCVHDGAECPSGPETAAGVIAVLEAADVSMRNGGRMSPVRCPSLPSSRDDDSAKPALPRRRGKIPVMIGEPHA